MLVSSFFLFFFGGGGADTNEVLKKSHLDLP